MQAQKEQIIDHMDFNPLNNQKKNLRFATKSQNNIHRPKNKQNKSGYKGVVFKQDQPRSRPWVANIMVNKKSINLGYFDTPGKAAEAYNKAALEYYKEFAFLN